MPEGEPAWWKEIREKILGIVFDADRFYEETSDLDELMRRRKAELKKSEKQGDPEVILEYVRKMAKSKRPYHYHWKQKSDFS